MQEPAKPQFQSVHDIYLERVRECAELTREKFNYAIRPIYGKAREPNAKEPLIVHLGSCTLLDIEGNKLLLTAAHVMDLAERYILSVAGRSETIPLTFDKFDKAIITNPEKNRNKDKVDFSLLKLTDAMQTELGKVTYIPQSDFCLDMPTSAAHARMAFGYPVSKQKDGTKIPWQQITGMTWTYYNRAVNDRLLAAKLGLHANEHKFIEFDHTKQHYPDRKGSFVLHPEGASGGALFDLGRQHDVEKLAKPAQCEAKLAGVLVSYLEPKKLIVATGMNAVFEGYRRLCELP